MRFIPAVFGGSVAVLVSLMVAAGCSSGAASDPPMPVTPDTKPEGPPVLPVKDAGTDGESEAGPDAAGPKPPLVWQASLLGVTASARPWSIAGTDDKLWIALQEYAGQIWHSRILESVNQGTTWTKKYENNNDYALLLGVWAASATEAYAVGSDSYTTATDEENAVILHTVDGGGTWAKTLRRKGSLQAVWGSGPNDVYAGGYTGTSQGTHTAAVDHSTDGGKTWVPVSSPEISKLKEIRGIWGAGPNAVFVAGNGSRGPGGGVVRSTNGGAAWSTVHSSPTASFWSAFGIPAKKEVFAPAFDGTIARSLDDGTTWTPTKIAGSIWGNVWSDGQRYYVAGNTSGSAPAPTMQRSFDGAMTWQAEKLPAGIPTIGSITHINATGKYVFAVIAGNPPSLLRAAR